ncbi:Tc toxin subunit A [Pseudomonas sp. P2757]|uniref:Tc toxin subunit A n=1 Tax=unclassified Pseudomonas TaxID=196821 RepID=UPI003B5B8640
MKASQKSAVDQLVRAVLGQGKKRLTVPRKLDDYLKTSPSVFDVIKLSEIELQKFNLTPAQAKTLLTRGRALALKITRMYRQQELRAAPQSNETLVGTLPTYDQMFNPNIHKAASQGSPEHKASTTAYLLSLREFLRDSIECHKGDGAITLEERRPDVDQLLIDTAAINEVKSRVDIHTGILEKILKSQLPAQYSTLKEFLGLTRVPMSMPYEVDAVDIWHVVAQVVKNGSLGTILRWLDSDFPYFTRAGGRGARDHMAWQLTLKMGTEAAALQLESPVFPLTADQAQRSLQRVDPRTGCIDADPQKALDDFYQRHYGKSIIGLPSLQRLWLFKGATNLDQEGVDRAFAWGRFQPKRSPNVPSIGSADEVLTGETAGARYINGGEKPAIAHQLAVIDEKHLLTNIGEAPATRLEHRTDRIQRKLRMDEIMQSGSHEVDKLMIAAMNAEHRGGASSSLWIRPGTLSCLGLFWELINTHGCTADECAGLVDVLSVYGQNGERPFFDQVYNKDPLVDDALLINGRPLAIIPVTADEQHMVNLIRSALTINGETYRYLSTIIAEAKGKTTFLDCDLPTLTALWRLVRLARISGLTPIEYTALAQTLGLTVQLAAEPVVSNAGTTNGADVLSAIDALMNCAQWASDYGLSVMWLVQNINPLVVPTVWTEKQEQFLRQLASQAQSVLLQSATLLAAGAPARHPKTEQLIEWMSLLNELVDDDGVVSGEYDQTEAQYQAYAGEKCAAIAYEIYPDPDPPEDPNPVTTASREALTALLLSIVLRCRDEQRALVKENLAHYLGINSLLTGEVLAWAEAHPYRFLAQALSMPEARERWAVRAAMDEPDQFLRMLGEVERRARIADRLNLSPTLLAMFLARENYQWFSCENRYDISINSLYYLALFGRLVEQAGKSEENLLDYLLAVNLIDPRLSEDARRLVRDAAADKLARFFGCGITHVLTVVRHLKGDVQDSDQLPLLQTLRELGVLQRTLDLASKGLDATASVSLGNLNSLDSQAQYANAAKHSLESYQRFTESKTQPETGEAGQSYTTVCTVDNPYLIAKMPLEVAEIRLQLRDFFGFPLKGVPIQFNTDLGVILTPEVKTDDQGRAVALLHAGKTMGAAHVFYNLLLSDPVHGPTVTIGPDMDSLRFNPEESSALKTIPPLRAGKLEEVRLFALLEDDYKNLVSNFPVEWRTTRGEMRPRQTVTDKDGISSVWVSSLSAGTAEYTVGLIDRSHVMSFADELTFKGTPRIFGIPYASTAAMAGEELLVRCKVAGLDGEPVEDAVVSWSTDPATTEEDVPTDPAGVSLFTVSSPVAGPLTIFARLGSDPRVELTVEVFDHAVISAFLAKPPIAVIGASSTLVWLDVADESGPDGTLIEHYPVQWKDDSRPIVIETIPTDKQGRSVYPFEVKKVGTYTVTATLQYHPTEVKTFTVEAIEAFGWIVNLFTLRPGGGEDRMQILPLGPGRLDLLRGMEYRIEFTPVDAAYLHESIGAGGWSSPYSTKALAMLFNPAMAQRFTYDQAKPHVMNLVTGDVRDGDFQISLHFDLLPLPLVLPGSLRKRPLTRRTPKKS